MITETSKYRKEVRLSNISQLHTLVVAKESDDDMFYLSLQGGTREVMSLTYDELHDFLKAAYNMLETVK